jgi:uncharacterized protein
VSSKHPKRTARPGVNVHGRTPLHLAVVRGDLAAVGVSLAAGSDPNAQDDDGWTPLHFAAQANATTLIEVLLNAGAQVDVRDKNGNTPLFRAVFSCDGNGEPIRTLRLAGADAHAKNAHGISPFRLAQTIANHDVARFFVDVGSQRGA